MSTRGFLIFHAKPDFIVRIFGYHFAGCINIFPRIAVSDLHSQYKQ